MESTKLEIIEQPALRRVAVRYRIEAQGSTPSKVSVAQHIASKHKGTVVVMHVHPQTGQQAAIAHALVYDAPNVAKALTTQAMLAKQLPKPAEGKEE